MPNDMITVLAGEPTDFTIQGRRAGTGGGAFLLLFGSVWTLFTGAMVFAFLHPLLNDGMVHFTLNEQAVVATRDNLEPLTMPAIFFGIFLLIGLGLLLGGIWSLTKKPGYYAGTPTRLVSYERGKINSFDWREFNGNIEVNSRKGMIRLELKSGFRSNSTYVPTQLRIYTKADVLEIERKVRERIQAAREGNAFLS